MKFTFNTGAEFRRRLLSEFRREEEFARQQGYKRTKRVFTGAVITDKNDVRLGYGDSFFHSGNETNPNLGDLQEVKENALRSVTESDNEPHTISLCFRLDHWDSDEEKGCEWQPLLGSEFDIDIYKK